MQQVKRGFRGKLDSFLRIDEKITVDMSVHGCAVYDFSCFGVDKDNKLSDDRYMVFYNQKASPRNEITVDLKHGRAVFTLDLQALPQTIDKLVFTVSIDGNGTMAEISRSLVNIGQGGRTDLNFELVGSDFFQEKAVISLEIYRKGVWRVNCVGQGFNGGLSELLKYYGGEEDTSGCAPENAGTGGSEKKVSLEKRLAAAPELVSLAKPLQVSLKKYRLEACKAKVGLVLDASGSMKKSYKDGTVQEIVNRILPLAVQFDDDGEIDLWFYAYSFKRFDSVNLNNYKASVPAVESRHKSASEYVSGGGPMNFAELYTYIGGRNNETAVMKAVIDEYKSSDIPAFVVFITDGGVRDKAGISKLLSTYRSLPIFWQFVGVRGKNYGVLEELDALPQAEAAGFRVNNANFFALDDFASVDSADLYSRLLSKFPAWLKERRYLVHEPSASKHNGAGASSQAALSEPVLPVKSSSSKANRRRGEIVARYIGTGDDVLSNIYAEPGVYRLHVVYRGKEDINVSVYYADETMNWLISSYGQYDGYVAVSGRAPYTFEVQSSGNWELELERAPLSEITCFSGEGDDITDIFASTSRVWHITHEGSESFDVSVHFVKRGDTDWLVSKDGRYDGKVRFVIPRGDTAFFEVKAVGKWFIEPI